ncbi:unnamed protein product [Porites evermanni]|uniref:CHY-type domain-containing protein n=1 Tax=Porites evermanni TaxID=104178 RepID=A0ABN8LWJ4_9CNID|nr:unnamed protein product [Porites evermanni]
MSGHDSSDQDILSSDSEESFENENSIGNHLHDLLGNSLHQTSLDGASLKEKKPVPADLDEDLGSRARFHEDSEKRHKQPYGAHIQAGSFAGYQLGNTASDGNVVLAGASLLGTSILESHLCDVEHSTMESPLRPMEGKEPELEERELWEAESLQQQQESIPARSQWLCEHYQRHCNVQFPCCTQFYPCHRCHNISRACENEEAKACHATHLKCSYCQHEQENLVIVMIKSVIFYCISINFICHFRIQQDKSFHCEICNVCLDKRLKGNHQYEQLINCLTRDQRIFAKSTMRFVLHFTLFSDRAKHRSFPVNFPSIYLISTRGTASNVCPQALSPPSPPPPLPFPFVAIFFPEQRACRTAQSRSSSLILRAGLFIFNLHQYVFYFQFAAQFLKRRRAMKVKDELRDDFEMLRRCIIEGNVEGAKEVVFECEKKVDHNHGLCICRNCLSSREDVLDQEVSPVLPIYAESSCNSSTKNRADVDDNNNYCALLHSIPEGIAPNFLAKHTQDKSPL